VRSDLLGGGRDIGQRGIDELDCAPKCAAVSASDNSQSALLSAGGHGWPSGLSLVMLCEILIMARFRSEPLDIVGKPLLGNLRVEGLHAAASLFELMRI
jgi:hypothetical protein